jgi:tetratricopeptide (TPR) repeat protein
MKRIIFLLLAFATTLPVYCQTLQDGDKCFDAGDYLCAQKEYQAIFDRSSGRDKQIAEIKLTRVTWCIEHIKAADAAFNRKNYAAAKENYQKALETNSKDPYATAQIAKCNKILVPTTLSVSKNILSFTSSGGREIISVTTNADSYTVSNSPSWCTVTKQAGSLTITCDSNSSTESRKGSFTVAADDKTGTVYVSQAGKIITLNVSAKNLFFNIEGGTKRIDITTNADAYTVNDLPAWWCTVTKYADYFTVYCNYNHGYSARKSYFTVKAGDKKIQIDVSQSGVTSSTSSVSSYSRIGSYKCFNCPKAKYPWGISLGYINKVLDNSGSNDYNEFYHASYDNLSGIQMGFHFEPLFKYGFGLNMGLYYEYYSTLFMSFYDEYDEYDEHVITVPLHLEYRFNFSKYFNLFVYGGAGFDVTSSTFNSDDIKWHTAMEYGVGLRINHIQLNVGQSVYIKEWNDFSDFSGMLNNNRYKNFSVSISYMSIVRL